MILARIVLTFAIGLAATPQTLAHGGHGGNSDPSGLYHYMVLHGLGVVLLLALIGLVWGALGLDSDETCGGPS